VPSTLKRQQLVEPGGGAGLLLAAAAIDAR
jgi:hypothetical protein